MKNTNTNTNEMVNNKVVELNDKELNAVNGGISDGWADFINILPAGSLIRDIADDVDGKSKLTTGKIVKDVALGIIDGSIIGYPIRALCSGIWNLIF